VLFFRYDHALLLFMFIFIHAVAMPVTNGGYGAIPRRGIGAARPFPMCDCPYPCDTRPKRTVARRAGESHWYTWVVSDKKVVGRKS
jgi:hypothetical protein